MNVNRSGTIELIIEPMIGNVQLNPIMDGDETIRKQLDINAYSVKN
tara:strand:+ start:152 stop:289 length:138 start_codon:yes stop_codon:yes gene_type:complete